MKNRFIIIFLTLTFVFLIMSVESKSQNEKDTMAFIRISNSKLIDFYTLEFDLYIERKSDKWIKFVNGTFALSFEDTINFKLDPAECLIYSVGSELKQDVVTGKEDIPTRGYKTDIQVYENRLSITILGPEQFSDCDSVAIDNKLLLGTFRVHSKQRLPSYKMEWLTPYYWYQACAFKLEQDSLYNGEIVFFGSDDNVSMEDSTSITYEFIRDTTQRIFSPVIFDAKYVGKKNTEYTWYVKNEYDVYGYTVYRQLEFPGVPLTNFNDGQLIGTWKAGSKFNESFIARGNFDNVLQYQDLVYEENFKDTIEFRGGAYIYALWATVRDSNGTVKEMFLDTARVPAPRAVIVESRITGANPFTSSTEIEYKIDDDAKITIYASDVLGKEIKNLKDETGKEYNDLEKRVGTYRVKFDAPELASQGLYNIKISAAPILDPTAEVSTSIIKVTLVR